MANVAEPQNALLRVALSARKPKLLRKLTRVVFDAGQQFWLPGDPIPCALFPSRGVISLQRSPSPARRVEIALVGSEGFVGVPLVLGSDTTRMVAVALTAGEAVAMPKDVFREYMRAVAFRTAVERYVNAFIVLLAERSLCHRVHVLQEFLATWLLHIQDRTQSDFLQATQDFCSRMLGVRRASISRAAAALQERGAIQYDRHGRLAILDRGRLEKLACPCYRVIRTEFDRILEP